MKNIENKGNTQFIMMDTDALDKLIHEVITTVKTKIKTKPADWIDEAKAKELLGVSSKSTMQRFRDEDRVIYSAVTKKNIMYSRASILRYMNTKSNKQYV